MPVFTRVLRAAAAGAAILGSASVAAPAAAQEGAALPNVRTSADSSFTDEQAERGSKVFLRVCLECHERLEMSNDDFRLKWGGQTTFDLFQNIATTMPDSDPGSLPRGDYVDVVSYILKLNGVPTGMAELAGDSATMSVAKLRLPLSTEKVGASTAAPTDTVKTDSTKADSARADSTKADTSVSASRRAPHAVHQRYFPHSAPAR